MSKENPVIRYRVSEMIPTAGQYTRYSMMDGMHSSTKLRNRLFSFTDSSSSSSSSSSTSSSSFSFLIKLTFAT